jgi:hypothetical protein
MFMNFKKATLFLLSFFFIAQSWAISNTDTLLNAFRQGKFSGQGRYYFMATDNTEPLTDYKAHAAGIQLHYQTSTWRGFSIGIGTVHTFNLSSPDFNIPDSITGMINRYETGLFDQTDPSNKKQMNLLQEAFIAYERKKMKITWGRQKMNTPFINPQDGRMRPTAVSGIWMESKNVKNWKWEGGWIYGVSPRGSFRFYNVASSIGLYPQGVQSNGTKAQYKDHLNSDGIFLLGIRKNVNANWQIQFWNQFTENISNTVMLETHWKKQTSNQTQWEWATQFIRQDGVGNGGNESANLTYFDRNGKSFSFGTKISMKKNRMETQLAYNRITKAGKVLLPREWGRDPYYTFISRERNEGLADVHAVTFRVNYHEKKNRFKPSLAIGYYQLPDVKKYEWNKYGMPSYIHANLDLRYAFTGLLSGLDLQCLIVAKKGTGETYQMPKYEFNKVNMILYNFVVNYNF